MAAPSGAPTTIHGRIIERTNPQWVLQRRRVAVGVEEERKHDQAERAREEQQQRETDHVDGRAVEQRREPLERVAAGKGAPA